MTTIVKLRAQYTNLPGGTCYRGETIGVDDEIARGLIARGHAEAVERVTKPITDTRTLKGFAKVNLLRRRIREYGAVPAGGIEAMAEQLRSLGG